jgi:hypothetical protein
MLVVIIYCFTIFILFESSCVYNQSSTGSAINQLNSAVSEALKLAIPYKFSRKSKFPCWFSSSLKYFTCKKNLHLRRYKKTKSDTHYSYFTYFRKLVKLTIKSDGQQWFKYIDDSLKTHPQHLWKYVCNFKRKDNSFIQLKIDNQFVTDPKHVADAFANYFK